MNKRLDTRLQKRHRTRTVLFARCQHTPESLQPAIAPITPSTLSYLPVDHHSTNRLLPKIVRRWNIRFDKSKIIVPIIPKTLRKVDRILVVRHPSPSLLQDFFPMFRHPTEPCSIRQNATTVNRRKHRLNLLQQPFAVTSHSREGRDRFAG